MVISDVKWYMPKSKYYRVTCDNKKQKESNFHKENCYNELVEDLMWWGDTVQYYLNNQIKYVHYIFKIKE